MRLDYIIRNAHILTMEGRDYENGYVMVRDGKIEGVGEMSKLPPDSAREMVDADGAYVSPGFVDAHCHIGMWEDSLAFEGDDGNEDVDPIVPQMRAIDAINPMDKAFKEAFFSGVTTVVTGPGSANPIGGQFAALKTVGRRVDDMIIKASVAMKFSFGENPKNTYHGKNISPATRMGTAALIREALTHARRYADDWKVYNANPENEDRPDFDFKLDNLARVLDGGLLVKAHAHRADDIFTALRIAREFGLNMTIEHCTDGRLIADMLTVPVCLGPSMTDRGKPELANQSFETAAALHNQGLSVAIVTDHPETPARYLSLCAALAVKSGMEPTAAHRAITINAARNCGIADRVGSIAPGKDADILITRLHPLDFNAKLQIISINGILHHI